MKDTNTATAVTTICLGALGAALALAYRLHAAYERHLGTRPEPVPPELPGGYRVVPSTLTGKNPKEYEGYRLLIVRCHDPLMWYVNKVGSTVPYYGTWKDDGLHKSREFEGFINIVRPTDAYVIRNEKYL